MLKKLAPYTKGYRLLMLLAIACSAGEAVLELLLPQVMSDIVDVGIATGDRAYILTAGVKMILMALLALSCGVGAAALAARASMGFGAALRRAEYEQVQRFSFANIERFSTASLVTRLTNDVASVQMTTFMGMRMLVRAPTMLVTAMVMALIISARLSQVFLVVIPLLVIAVAIVIKRVGPFFTSLQGATDDVNLVVQEDLNAIRVVKSFVREEQEKAKFAQRSDRLRSMAERAFGFVVLFMPEYNGCKRWLVLPGLGTLQPSEIAKFAVVLVFAHIIALNHDRMGSFAVGVLPFALVLGAVAVLMLLEPHLSGTVLILGIGAVLMFVGGTGLRWFMLAGAGGAAAIGTAIVLMPELVPYAADRLNSWLDPFADPLGDGHQTIQSLYAIGSGGATGLGLGNSRQKHLFVPEPQNDFIFSIVCEELGFVGACAVVLLFVLLLWRGITIAAHAPDRFGALLVVGFTVQVALQAVLNVAVVTNTIPNTGISLPFFSSGGTSLMMLLGEMGIVLSVSRGET